MASLACLSHSRPMGDPGSKINIWMTPKEWHSRLALAYTRVHTLMLIFFFFN